MGFWSPVIGSLSDSLKDALRAVWGWIKQRIGAWIKENWKEILIVLLGLIVAALLWFIISIIAPIGAQRLLNAPR